MNSVVENKLPVGWKKVDLGRLSEYINGYAFKSKDWSSKGLPIIRIQNLNGKKEYNFYDSEIKEKYRVSDGDILISWSASFDVYKWNSGDAVLNQHIFNTRINTDIISKEFFFHTIKYSLSEMSRNLHGMGMKHITKGKFERIKVPLPPLQEQKRIVEKIDTLFAKIDKAIRLTEESLKQAKNLLPSVLKEVFEKGKADGWKYEKLGVLGKLTSSKRIYKKEYVAQGIPFYRSREIKELSHNRKISVELFISEQRYTEIKNKFGTPKDGDILLTAVGTIGEMYIVKENEKFYFKDGNIMWLKDFSNLSPYYLRYALTYFVERLKTLSQGSAYQALTIEKLKEYSIPIPALKEQKKIAANLDRILNQTIKTQSKLEEQLAYLKQLKSSILSKAFKGELINNNESLLNE